MPDVVFTSSDSESEQVHALQKAIGLMGSCGGLKDQLIDVLLTNAEQQMRNYFGVEVDDETQV